MNFSGVNTQGQHSASETRLSEEELMIIINLLDTLPPGATLQSVLVTNETHPVVPILLALNPSQLQQIQQCMASRMRQLSQRFLQPQLLQQVQFQPKRSMTIQPRQSVLVPPSSNECHNTQADDWVCSEDNCTSLNAGWRAACCNCGLLKPTVYNSVPQGEEQHIEYHTSPQPSNQDHNTANYTQRTHRQRSSSNSFSNQEPMQSYDNTQPSDDYPLEPLGVDVETQVGDDINDMEIETFNDANSSIISVKKVVESPVKQRPPPSVINPRANALIPPPMSAQNQQHTSLYHVSPQIPHDQFQPNENYENHSSQYDVPIERPLMSSGLADQEQNADYDNGDEFQDENQNSHSVDCHYEDPQYYNYQTDRNEPLVMSDRTIYVKNIVTDEDELEKLFNTAGKIRDIRMKHDQKTPFRSAFIEYWNKEDAKVAYDTLHGIDLAGKRLQVGWAVARVCM